VKPYLKTQQKNSTPTKSPQNLSGAVGNFMKHQVYKRQKKLTALAHAWTHLLPDELIKHCCLESFRGGTLTVLVDGAGYLSELDLMIREGLLDQLRQLCPTLPLSRIKLKRGRWYHIDEEGNKITEF